MRAADFHKFQQSGENVRPVSKNPIIAAFFKEIGRADELGSGTRNLYHYTRLYSGADPIIDEEDAFSVTVPLNDAYSPEVGEGEQGNPPANPPANPPVNPPERDICATLTKSARAVLAALKSDSSLTYDTLAVKLKLHRDTIRVSIASLVRMNLLRRVGSDKTGHWEIVER